jgi:hypothetical protein
VRRVICLRPGLVVAAERVEVGAGHGPLGVALEMDAGRAVRIEEVVEGGGGELLLMKLALRTSLPSLE